MRDHEREDQQTAYILYGAGVSPWQREIYSPPRASIQENVGGLLEEAATLLVTYFDSVCERARRGVSAPGACAHASIVLGVWSRFADSDRSRDEHYVLNCIFALVRWCG